MLIALNILSFLVEDNVNLMHSEGPRTHALIEALRLSFADTTKFVCDPDFQSVPVEGLLSKKYARTRGFLFNDSSAIDVAVSGEPPQGACTVSFQIVDQEGNAVSAVNSNYNGFGTALIPLGVGFPLHNRGFNFVKDQTHANCIAPNKRPYHTIIPSLATYSHSNLLYASFTNMGAFMQPQGQMQLLVNLLDLRMNAQAAIDAPRFCVELSDNGNSLKLLYTFPLFNL